jgi:octaprenyl-diphosphate synthase
VTTARAHRVDASTSPPALLVARELERVEERLAEVLRSQEPLLTEIADYLIRSGGKRVRPAVMLLAFRACGGDDLTDIVDAAVALELIHSASLLHDDIIDGSDSRRGQDSAFRKYGLAQTLVTGDFLFGRAYQLCARFDEHLIGWAVDASIRLTEGEIMQGRFRRNPAVTFADYLEIVNRKTAALFQQGARTAAAMAHAPAEIVNAISRCGQHIGVTFQIVDDLLDVLGDEVLTGKPVGLDLREGNPSLPIVLLMQHDEDAKRLFQRADLSDGDIAWLLNRLRRSTVLQQGRTLATEHATDARDALNQLADTPYRQNLLWLIDELLARVS